MSPPLALQKRLTNSTPGPVLKRVGLYRATGLEIVGKQRENRTKTIEKSQKANQLTQKVYTTSENPLKQKNSIKNINQATGKVYTSNQVHTTQKVYTIDTHRGINFAGQNLKPHRNTKTYMRKTQNSQRTGQPRYLHPSQTGRLVGWLSGWRGEWPSRSLAA